MQRTYKVFFVDGIWRFYRVTDISEIIKQVNHAYTNFIIPYQVADIVKIEQV